MSHARRMTSGVAAAVNMRGKMAKNDQIEINMQNICEFDRRYQAAMSARSASDLHSLAKWADAIRLTLAHKARLAAEELSK